MKGNRLRKDAISAADLLGDVSAGDGAIVMFEGRVRDRNQGRTVARLHYDSYQEMAEQVLGDIRQRTLDAFPVTSVGVTHRAGTVEVGETAVAVTVAAPHRAAAFEAARFAIEAIKAELPVWKQEEYEDGTRKWLGGNPGPGADSS